MNVLVDTSIWIDFLHQKDETMQKLLSSKKVVMHPLVIAEVALGCLKQRELILEYMSKIKQSRTATYEEALMFIEKRKVWGKGVGASDVLLLCSVLVEGNTLLWTRDKRLAKLADDCDVAYQETLPSESLEH